jgi:hypothetical protein
MVDNGVVVPAGGRNLLRGNAISANGALGIDIDADGVTGAHVVWLTGATTSGTQTTIEGWLIGVANATYTVELFENVVADPSGFGEGETPLSGLYTISTDADGYGSLLVTLPFALEVGRCLSATATEADGTTWEFGNGLPIVASDESPAAPGRDAAWMLRPAMAAWSASPALPLNRERPSAEGTTLRIDSVPFPDQRADGAAVDAFFGGGSRLLSEAPPRRTAAVFPGEPNSFLWEEVFASDG